MFYAKKDFGIANLFITPDKLEVMDMSTPYQIDRACFVVPAPKVSYLTLSIRLGCFTTSCPCRGSNLGHMGWEPCTKRLDHYTPGS